MPCTPNCGACCDPVALSNAMLTVLLEGSPPPEDRAFVFDNWAPVDVDDQAVYFQCFVYDVEKRTCGAYDRRPPVCRGFPFYRQEGAERTLDGRTGNVCGYQDEIGRTVLPLVEIR